MPISSHVPAPLPLIDSFGHDAWAAIRLCDLHRRDDCAAYPFCLWRVAVERWRGFSCVACGAYEEDVTAFLYSAPPDLFVVGRARLPAKEQTERWLSMVDRVPAEPYIPVVTAEAFATRWGPRRRVLNPHWSRYRPDTPTVLVAPVGRAVCPVCLRAYQRARQPELIEQKLPTVLDDGYCPICRRYLDATEDGLKLIENVASLRYLALKRAKKAAQQRRRAPRLLRTAQAAAKGLERGIAEAIDTGEQLGLWEEE